MGHSLIPVPFTDTGFAIRPHTATDAKHVGKRVTLNKFSRGEMTSVYRRDDNNEFVFKGANGRFAQGPFASLNK